MHTMAKKRPTVDRDAEDGSEVRPKLVGVLVECIRFEADDRGIENLSDCVRAVLMERYKQLGWLTRDENQKWQFRPPDEASGKQ